MLPSLSWSFIAGKLIPIKPGENQVLSSRILGSTPYYVTFAFSDRSVRKIDIRGTVRDDVE